jgi:hypothetical protein
MGRTTRVWVCAVVLLLSTLGSAYGDVGWNFPPYEVVSGMADVDQFAFGLALLWDPETLVALGLMSQDLLLGPGAGSAEAGQSGYVSETQITATGAQSTYMSGTQTSSISGDGIGLIDSDMYVLTVQRQQ